jgi:hypothetical protein
MYILVLVLFCLIFGIVINNYLTGVEHILFLTYMVVILSSIKIRRDR